MKAVIIVGSARKGGNTDILCRAAGNALEDRGFQVTVLHPYEMRISHCTNCGGCNETGVCVIDDDMRLIYDAVSENDVIVFGTPIHFSGMSSILKQVVDRFQCLWIKPSDRRRKVLGLISHGGSENPYFKNITSVSKATAISIGAEWGGEVTISSTDDGISDECIQEAYYLGSSMADRINAGRIDP